MRTIVTPRKEAVVQVITPAIPATKEIVITEAEAMFLRDLVGNIEFDYAKRRLVSTNSKDLNVSRTLNNLWVDLGRALAE